jgi:uncharacterized protein YggE
MRFSAPIPAAIVFCFFANAAASSADEAAKDEGRKVVATAAATGYVDPDGARLTFLMTTTENVEKSAREMNEKQVKKVRDALAGLSIVKLPVEVRLLPSTASTTVGNPEAPGGPRPMISKTAQTTVQVTVHETDLPKLRSAVARLAEIAIEHGGAGSERETQFPRLRLPRAMAVADEPERMPGPSIEWLSSDAARVRREVIRRATKEAIADAEAAAGVGNLKVVEINVRASEGYTAFNARLLADSESHRSIQIPVHVEVQVTCRY